MHKLFAWHPARAVARPKHRAPCPNSQTRAVCATARSSRAKDCADILPRLLHIYHRERPSSPPIDRRPNRIIYNFIPMHKGIISSKGTNEHSSNKRRRFHHWCRVELPPTQASLAMVALLPLYRHRWIHHRLQ